MDLEEVNVHHPLVEISLDLQVIIHAIQVIKTMNPILGGKI